MMGGKEVGSVRELGSIASCHIHAVISKIDKSIKSIVAQRNSYRIPSGEGGGRWGGAHEGGGGTSVETTELSAQSEFSAMGRFLRQR